MVSINNVTSLEQLDNWRERMESYHQSILYANNALAEGMAMEVSSKIIPVAKLEDISFRYDSKLDELKKGTQDQ